MFAPFGRVSLGASFSTNMSPPPLLDQGIRHLGVQAAGRLIQEQQGGASNQRERNVGTLPLATGDASDQAWGADHGVGTLPQVQLVDDIFNHLARLFETRTGG